MAEMIAIESVYETSVNKSQEDSSSFYYRPGDWNQDIYTIPLEALVVTLVSQSEPPDNPRWPFNKETANGFRNPSRQPGYYAVGLSAGIAAPLVGSIFHDNPNFPALTHARGLIHSHLLTEFVTSSAKVGFGRKRPFYDTETSRGTGRKDDRLSFFSGHASHTFAFAAYASRLAANELKEPGVAALYSAVLFGSAGWMASSRALDGQHNWSDVIAGAAAGTLIGALTYGQVSAVHAYSVDVTASSNEVTVTYHLP